MGESSAAALHTGDVIRCDVGAEHARFDVRDRKTGALYLGAGVHGCGGPMRVGATIHDGEQFPYRDSFRRRLERELRVGTARGLAMTLYLRHAADGDTTTQIPAADLEVVAVYAPGEQRPVEAGEER